MNELHPLTNSPVSKDTYEQLSWALATGAILIVFFFLCWLSIQRTQIFIARRHQFEAEDRASAAERERDKAQRESAETAKDLNEKLANAEAAREAAEKEAREVAAKAFNSAASATATETVKEKPAQPPTRMPDPTVEGLTAFIKAHLSHMAESVEAQLPDYAEEVDFHDKPHASQTTIKTEREAVAQKFPVRLILKDEIQPQIAAVRDARYGWLATATFDWRWIYRSRSNSLVRGVTRDTWKIIPSANDFKIISEHSADPVTGQSKD